MKLHSLLAASLFLSQSLVSASQAHADQGFLISGKQIISKELRKTATGSVQSTLALVIQNSFNSDDQDCQDLQFAEFTPVGAKLIGKVHSVCAKEGGTLQAAIEEHFSDLQAKYATQLPSSYNQGRRVFDLTSINQVFISSARPEIYWTSAAPLNQKDLSPQKAARLYDDIISYLEKE